MSSVEPPKAVRLTADGITAGVAVMPSVGVSSAWRVALLVSLAIHGALLTWAVVHFSTALPGARGVQLEGIEIEIISAAALESLMRVPIAEAGGDAAVTADTVGQVAVVRSEPPTQETAPQVPQTATIVTAPEADARVSAAVPEPSEPLDKKLVELVPQTTAAAATPVAAGGVMTEAAVPSTRQAAAAGAGPGDVARYASDVRRVLSRSRPKSGWPAGTLRVAFTVSDTGDVASAEVVVPSGNARLDQRALAWVGATRFPPPPVGLTVSERTYAIPLTVTGKGL